MIDALAVSKDADGGLEVEHLSNLTQEEAGELGSKVGALIGLQLFKDLAGKLGIKLLEDRPAPSQQGKVADRDRRSDAARRARDQRAATAVAQPG